jgi:poly(3-hydroxybutyrate) depolymerase
MPKVGSPTGAAGANATGNGTGAAGSNDPTGNTGAAGDNGGGSGAAGDSGGTGAAGSSTTGNGTGTGGTGAGGSGTTGVGGTTGNGGAIGTGGATGTGGSAGGGKGPTGMSTGCGMAPMDAPGKFVHHTIAVTGIASTVKPATGGGSWTMRDYYLQLPTGYDPSKPYPVLFGGGGCGGNLVSNGSSGGFTVLGNNSQAIQIGMSYVWPQGGGACFDDNGSDTPDLPYFDAILAEVEKNNCVDKSKVFVGGYSSGGWESYMLGLARGGVVRGISPAAGGLRMSRPPGSNIPIAALLLTGGNDTANPAEGPTGSDAAMALILQINGCQGTATVPWETACAGCGCNRYTGCPAYAPVVRCRPPGQGHTDGGGAFKTAIWQTWMSLPAYP